MHILAKLERQSEIRLNALSLEVENISRVADLQGMLYVPPTLTRSIDPTVKMNLLILCNIY